MPKVSIIIPAYNAQDTIERCLESIARQSYRDFEVVCVDDGSTDKTPELIDSFCFKDPRFKCFHRENGGAASARNAGLGEATGEFVAFVDADDLLPQHTLKRMHQITVLHECDTVMGMYERVDGMTAYTNSRSASLINGSRRIEPDDLDIIHTWTLCNKWLSRKIIEENGLRLERYTHLEDAVFLYKYLAHAKNIYGCPHVIYTYVKPLPIVGRTTTQGANASLFESSYAAFERLEELTAAYGPAFHDELRYRYANSPLIGDYYRRIWKLDAATASRLRQIGQACVGGLGWGHREKLTESNFDLLGADGLLSVDELAANPLLTVAVGRGLSREALREFIAGLYDQGFVSFRLVVPREKEDCIPETLRYAGNLKLVDGEPYGEAVAQASPYTAFIDAEVLYDHRSLSTMVRHLERHPELDFAELDVVCLARYGLDGLENGLPEGESAEDTAPMLANKLFRTTALSVGEIHAMLADGMRGEKLQKPCVVRYEPLTRLDERLDEKRRVEKEEALRKERKKRNPLRRAKRKLGRLVRGMDGRSQKPRERKALDCYLNDEVDPTLVVLEGLGKRPRGNLLYVLRELQKPEYSQFHVAFSVTEDTREDAKALFEREGFERVKPVVAGSTAYKEALFTAGYLFNEVDFPNWWTKKARQTYVNIWHGTPLKTLGKAKVGDVHHDANASRNFTMADYLLFPNEFTMRHLLGDCDVDGLARGKALMLGYPRTGQLFDATKRDEVRGRLGLENKRVYAYMPTYRETLGTAQVQRLLDELEGLLQEDERLFVNLHHKTAANVEYGRYSKIAPFPAEWDTYEFLCAVDCLVTDYSSIMFDFAATKRPIVLYCPDLEEYCSTRGLYRDVRDLPFPLCADAASLVHALRGKHIPYSDFNREFNAYDSSNNAIRLCRTVLLGDSSGVCMRDLAEVAMPCRLIVSDGLREGPALDALYSIRDAGWPKDTYLSFLEQEVDKQGGAAYPLVRQVPLFATKGTQLSERTEQLRLYGGLDMAKVVVVDTVSNTRIRAFARFDVPRCLFIQPEVAQRLLACDEETVAAVKLFEKWGDGLYTFNEEIARDVSEAFGWEVGHVNGLEQFRRTLL